MRPRRPATSVVVLRCPCGKPIRSRSPLAQRPWLRVMLVAVQVSSMNTSRSGSRSSWPSNQSCRWLRTSGRSCSIAWPVFFARHAVTNEEAMKPGHRDVQADLNQRQAQFLKRDVLARLPHGQDFLSPLLDPARAHVATLRLGSKIARHASLILPADRRRGSDPKASRRRPTTHTVIDRRQKPSAQIHR